MSDDRVFDEQSSFLTALKSRRVDLALSISRLTIWVMISLFSLIFVVWLAMREYSQILIFSIVVAVMGIVSWAYGYLVEKGRSNLAGIIYLGWFVVLTFSCPFLLPNLIPSTVACYLFTVMMGSVIWGKRGFLSFTVVSLIGFACNMIYVENPAGYWFQPLPYNLGPILGGVIGSVAMVVLSWYIRKILANQDTMFLESQQSKYEVEKKVAQEQARRKILQQTVADYVDMMTSVGQGNLSARIPIDARANADDDPLISLGLQLNGTIASLEAMIKQLGEAASDLSAASAEIVAAMTQQISGSSEQSSAIAQTNTTVQEVRTIAEQSVARAQEVVTAAQQAADVSRTGQQAIEETMEGMTRIRESVESISHNILALSEQTQQIGEIITSVNDLASQSNMLALNAAVEAARAGEQGKGFAVVAQEVRVLAEQSKQATAQVKAILSEIQKATNTSVMATEEGIKMVEQGVRLSQRTQETVAQLAGIITESVNRMMQVMAGGHQQAVGMEQVSVAMANIHQVSVQSLASTRQSESTAQDLNKLALRLNQTLASYERKDKTNRIDFATARLAHKNWISRLVDFIDGRAVLTDETVITHRECELGKWIYSTALPKYNSSEMQELERVHASFHHGLKRVVQLKQSGQSARAEDELLSVQKLTDRIFTLLTIAEKQQTEHLN